MVSRGHARLITNGQTKGVLWNDETVLNLDCDSGYTLYLSKFIDLYTKEDTFCHV